MLLHDRVTVISREEVGWDDLGLPLYEETETLIPAQVDPATTTEGQDQSGQLISRYRVMMKAPHGFDLSDVRSVKWRGETLNVDGRIQPQMLRGRVSHHEFVSQRVTG